MSDKRWTERYTEKAIEIPKEVVRSVSYPKMEVIFKVLNYLLMCQQFAESGTPLQTVLSPETPQREEKHLIYSISDATSAEEVYNLLNEIEKTGEPEIQDWVEYYKYFYVLSSLNKHISKMNIEIWNRSSNNINHVEVSHANSNRNGKNLKLFTAIKREYQIDNKHIKISITHNNTGVPYTRRDRSEIKRKSQAMTCKG
ncbi:unnamed protein product [Rhizophagus irregularis]|nr:unnamed protein product [Rhizophagus irregularis]CAB5370166.1 unnamed protein product [Rhizophagus irregularis]